MLAIIKTKPMITKTFFAMIVVLDDSRTFLISPDSPIKKTSPEMIVANWNVSIKVAANVRAWMWRYSVLRPPEPRLSKVNEDEDIFYSLALFVSQICPGSARLAASQSYYIAFGN